MPWAGGCGGVCLLLLQRLQPQLQSCTGGNDGGQGQPGTSAANTRLTLGNHTGEGVGQAFSWASYDPAVILPRYLHVLICSCVQTNGMCR